MRYKFLLVLLLNTLPIQDNFCQEKITIFYDGDWNITSSDNFQFRREAKFDFVKIVFDGEYKDYDKANHLIGEGNYSHGVKIGVHKTYFIDGSLKTALEWNNNEFTIEELKNDNSQTLVTQGTGKFMLAYSFPHSSKRKAEKFQGEFKNGKRVGHWIYFDSLGKACYEEIYKNGILRESLQPINNAPTSLDSLLNKSLGGKMPKSLPTPKQLIQLVPDDRIESFDFDRKVYDNLYAHFSSIKTNSVDSLTSHIRFPGATDYTQLISRYMRYPIKARQYAVSGKVVVRVTIDARGQAKNHKIINSIDLLDAEALRIIHLFDGKWFPALRKGKPYESLITIPIVFKL